MSALIRNRSGDTVLLSNMVAGFIVHHDTYYSEIEVVVVGGANVRYFDVIRPDEFGDVSVGPNAEGWVTTDHKKEEALMPQVRAAADARLAELAGELADANLDVPDWLRS